MATDTRVTTLVTGGAGLAGLEPAKLLVARRHRVFGLTDSVEAAEHVRRAGAVPDMSDLLEPGPWQDEAAAGWVLHLPPHAVHGPRMSRRRAASIARARGRRSTPALERLEGDIVAGQPIVSESPDGFRVMAGGSVGVLDE